MAGGPAALKRNRVVVDLLAQFATARQLFFAYREELRRRKTAHSGLVNEAYKRLSQAEFIIDRVERLERSHDQLHVRGPRSATPKSDAAHIKRRASLVLEIELLTESFYYVTWRLRDVLRDHVPGFKKFEATGVRTVRNELLEHPKDAPNPGFTWGNVLPRGPRIKPFGYETPPVRRHPQDLPGKDPGLYANAQEMLNAFLPRLERALDELKSEREAR